MYRESEIEVKPAGVQHPCLPRWRDRIAAARNRGHFTDREKMDADNWVRQAKPGKGGWDDLKPFVWTRRVTSPAR
jgi:hypothetical protein